MALSPKELAAVERRACRLVRDFISNTALPIVVRNANALPWTKYCHGLLARADAMMGSVLKLDDNGDFQAIAACARNLFENAVDFVLLAHQENGSFAKLMAWESSAQLKLAAAQTHVPEARMFIEANEAKVKDSRRLYWKGKHPSRWTGNSLGQDAAAADACQCDEANLLQGRTFSEYYKDRYSMNCWYVHGSGLIGLHGLVGSQISRVIAFAYRDSRSFALISAMCSMSLLKCRDPITLARVDALRKDILALYPGS